VGKQYRVVTDGDGTPTVEPICILNGNYSQIVIEIKPGLF